MHNKAVNHTVFVCSAGAFGVFLRWMQLQLAFDEQGLCGPSVFNWIVPAVIVLFALLLRARVKKLPGEDRVFPKSFRRALCSEGRVYALLRWAAALIMMGGGALTILKSETYKNVEMLRAIGALAILSGIGFLLLLSGANRRAGKGRRLLYRFLSVLPLILFSVWLIYDYKENAINSVVWAFAVEVLTVCALLFAFFRLAGYPFGQAEPKKALFALGFGVFMSLLVLADERQTGLQLIFFAAGLMLGLCFFLLIDRIHPKEEEEPADDPHAPLPDGGIEKL
ncbi:MAG: hypothetical protein K6G17_01285 [Oscillospiraceae bacterium]|nr:hypothetical protein [Oscillospiraceae bacterium]